MAAVRVVYFAAARELAECDAEQLELPRVPLEEEALRQLLAGQHPRLAPLLSRMRLALNGDFMQEGASIQHGDEITVLPPVAGGSDEPLVAVREAALSVDEVLAAVRRPEAGGICVFLGIVRDHADGQPVARLDYEAYSELAIKEMKRILQTLREESGDAVRLAATHRVGELAVGDIAVVVAASAPHRAEAFAACRAAIDRIKETVPIWKKEWSPDGTALWVNLE